ncbi:hypothetical protein [Paraburkholderia sp. C35]|uniref:hypothetical protein n=1 Tax=Paraburkholderia sp. C35 TaxID=2126993 RepID=UPI000D68FE66|nr:hypothetical protein [Paraburkholderia sp. C35]
MKRSTIWAAWPVLVLALSGCAAGGSGGSGSTTHLSAVQCRDLTELRNHAPLDHQRNMSELAALRSAGYDPSRWYDPYYPDDLEAAQRQVDRWYQAECQQANVQ